MCLCVCVYLYAPAEPRQSSSTEAKLNGEGRLKAVPRPAASVFNHRSPQHLSLHADQAAVKGPMHPATPIHKCTACAVIRILLVLDNSVLLIILNVDFFIV